jgi:toxin ParE1/3/4
MLVRNPGLGRVAGDIRSGLRRFEHGRHVIFYRSGDEGILILRLLHQSMMPAERLDDEDRP